MNTPRKDNRLFRLALILVIAFFIVVAVDALLDFIGVFGEWGIDR